jgi:hypothetical protein
MLAKRKNQLFEKKEDLEQSLQVIQGDFFFMYIYIYMSIYI